ncbi:hypothetical protein NEAUS04_0154 [Nematocida ausubeli]|nr:hypothetical protein NEAUS04_0154 [Nematocida ausubeli]
MDSELDSSYILLESREREYSGCTPESTQTPKNAGALDATMPSCPESVSSRNDGMQSAPAAPCENISEQTANTSANTAHTAQEKTGKPAEAQTFAASVVDDVVDLDSSGSDSILEDASGVGPAKKKIKRKYTRSERFINILTPKKEKSTVFLTPVKRTRRSVINGLKTGNIKVFNNSMEVRSNSMPYTSLVECFRKLEKAERIERRDSIDMIVKKYSGEDKKY